MVRKSLWFGLGFACGLATGLLCAAVAGADTVSHDAVTLTWTAPGDDSLVGQATEYDIRYATFPITEGNFGTATRWSGTKLPAAPGTLEALVITGLTPSTPYWFAIKTADEVPNWSAISNVLQLTTLAPPDTTRPAPVTDLRSP